MLRRIARQGVDDLDAVALLAAKADCRLILIFDADNTLVPQGIPPSEFRDRVNEAISRFEQIPTVEKVIFLTNGPCRGAERMISRGNKPWTSRRRLGLVGGNADVWIVGDQVLTDGILAWRLGALYLHRPIAETGEQPSQAIMRALGRIVSRLLFKRPSGPG